MRGLNKLHPMAQTSSRLGKNELHDPRRVQFFNSFFAKCVEFYNKFRSLNVPVNEAKYINTMQGRDFKKMSFYMKVKKRLPADYLETR